MLTLLPCELHPVNELYLWTEDVAVECEEDDEETSADVAPSSNNKERKEVDAMAAIEVAETLMSLVATSSGNATVAGTRAAVPKTGKLSSVHAQRIAAELAKSAEAARLRAVITDSIVLFSQLPVEERKRIIDSYIAALSWINEEALFTNNCIYSIVRILYTI